MQDDTPHAALLAHLWDEAALLVLRLDPTGRVTQANAFAIRHLGNECIGRDFRDLLVNFAVPADFDIQACANSSPLVLNFNTPSGQPATYRVGVLATDDGLLAIGSPDIDGLEKLQWQVLRLNGELSNMSRQLHQANAELTRLNALKDRFLGMAAHDLRKPLGAIMAYVDFLRDEAAAALTAEHAGFLTTIAQAATRMRGMIDSFLDVSVIQSGKLRLERSPVTAECIVAGIRPILDVAARTKGVKLTVDMGGNSHDGRAPAKIPAEAGTTNTFPPGIQAFVVPPLGGSVLVLDVDAGKIEQVLTNLVGNAIEHSSPGATVSVSVRASETTAVFAVQDEAGGIPEDRLAHLFEPFERAGTQKSGGERSIGLGLAIAHKIVEAHGGRIRVDSQWGSGSVFTVELPIPTHTNGGDA